MFSFVVKRSAHCFHLFLKRLPIVFICFKNVCFLAISVVFCLPESLYCGSYDPVVSSAPAILASEIETQKKKSPEKNPLKRSPPTPPEKRDVGLQGDGYYFEVSFLDLVIYIVYSWKSVLIFILKAPIASIFLHVGGKDSSYICSIL